MQFKSEPDFEAALIELLISQKGWQGPVLKYPTEEDLIQNWANILFENNREIDKLNGEPLTKGEMQQIMTQVNQLRSPVKANDFIKGKNVSIVRDNENDKLHFGKSIELKIYDRREIAAGQSRYQIAEQPRFKAKKEVLPDRRGDFMLLINGMPVIHVELKKSGVPIGNATNQIELYSHEGVFTGLFSLIQIFVAMTPDEALYFANPGQDGYFDKKYFFRWADFDNQPVNSWERIAAEFLNIPMAHYLIGFYTVADNRDNILKVLRSYQIWAVRQIFKKDTAWKNDHSKTRGGYIWHTTGSGKTLTSFKAAQLVADYDEADKVIFLIDRIELGTQSINEYRSFADETESVQETEDTEVLLQKLLSDNKQDDTLIVTSIQKMSRIYLYKERKADAIRRIQAKRLMFIVDEAHRSVFGEMREHIIKLFPDALFFGFTGTPIYKKNNKKMNTTADIFGDELHRYSIADGIRDRNVLGFDPYQVLTYKDRDLRRAVALSKAKAVSEDEALSDPKKSEVYDYYMNPKQVPMAGYYAGDDYIKGIEDDIPSSQYNRPQHREAVVRDVLDQWKYISRKGKFHGILATSSIPEAIEYYKLLKGKLKVAALFDESIDNNGDFKLKEDTIIEILTDYNAQYEQHFSISTFQSYKKDVSARLAHKDPYQGIERCPEQNLDLLIVVDQMLTGFDSKWVNILYLDKILTYERLIQAFSRTNRLNEQKPFGVIRYYRKPHTMKRNIDDAFKLYADDKPLEVFASKLEQNLTEMNLLFKEIELIFRSEGIPHFEKLPEDKAVRGKFAKLFKSFSDYLEAATIQGFNWDNPYTEDKTGKKIPFRMELDERTYLILLQRYKELYDGIGGTGIGDLPYEIDTHLTEISTEMIDADYMNARFVRYLKVLNSDGETAEMKKLVLSELHQSFAALSQEEQEYANIFLNDVQTGDVVIEDGRTLLDYIVQYQISAKNDEIHQFSEALGVDETLLRAFIRDHVKKDGEIDNTALRELRKTVNVETAKAYFERKGKKLSTIKLYMMMEKEISRFAKEHK